jgi:very-short-patch-repair endonuclease
LYIPKYNLCIEFDENQHKYNLENDKKRQKYITEKLKCNFLRINENDNIFDSINKILHFAKLF